MDEWGVGPAPANYANSSVRNSFPVAAPSSSNGAPKVLVIKQKVKVQPKSSRNGKPASSAAWNFPGSGPPNNNNQTGGVRASSPNLISSGPIPGTSTGPSFHRSNAAPPTAWANSSGSAMADITRGVSSLNAESAFPGLPTPQRKKKAGSSSPWTTAASGSNGDVADSWEIDDEEETGGKGNKRKGKGKKVLMHFG